MTEVHQLIPPLHPELSFELGQDSGVQAVTFNNHATRSFLYWSIGTSLTSQKLSLFKKVIYCSLGAEKCFILNTSIQRYSEQFGTLSGCNCYIGVLENVCNDALFP